MTNKDIIQILKQTASLLELFGENQFKVRSYQTAVYNLERTELSLLRLDKKQLAGLPGIGKSIAETIDEIKNSGTSNTLENLLKQTPAGILQLLQIKGIGARKIKAVWDELQVESVEDLYQAAIKGELSEIPGFGKKTQDKILQIVSYYLANKNLLHYKDAHLNGLWFEDHLSTQFDGELIARTGGFRRKTEVVNGLQYLWAPDRIPEAVQYLDNLEEINQDISLSGPLRWRGVFKENDMPIDIRFCKTEEFGSKLVYYTGSTAHLQVASQQGTTLRDLIDQPYHDESEVYQKMGWPVIIPELREGLYEREFLEDGSMDNILKLEDLQGVLHNHSTFSDGKHSLERMAKACQQLGYEYLGISDHSQTAVYANGLDEERVLAQHQEIDRLNQEMKPFRIFKGIESDILNDGSLDYPESFLHNFDFVVASIHFNLNMDIDQATNRLITAIENPHTTILGHPTGRQLLRREGYPIHYEKIIDACALHKVIIELNAHPWRLDLDWKWVNHAVNKGVRISINPDAHEKSGLEDVYYGVCVARKSGLTKDLTFNTQNQQEIANYFQLRKSKIISNSGAYQNENN